MNRPDLPGVFRASTVAAELIEHYQNGDSPLAQMLSYPLDYDISNLNELREVLFPQLWTFSLLTGRMEFLKATLPM